MYRLAGIFAAFVMLLGAAYSPAAAQDKTITVFAAASMKNALDEIDAAYTAKTGVKITASYAASSALAKQIEQGAPADVFISADTDWMDYAIGKKNINEPTRVNLLGNSHRADRAEGFQDRQRQYRRRLRPRQACRRRQDRDRRRQGGAGRQIRQGGAGETRFMAGRRAEIRDGRKRARGADAGGARRSCSRHRLFDRRQGRTRRQGRRHLPGRFPSGDHLSGRGDRPRRSRRRRIISPSCARPRRRTSSKNTASSSWSAPRPDVRDIAGRMDRHPAVAAGRRHGDAGGDAVRHRAGVAAGAA